MCLCRVAFECCQGSVYLIPRDPRLIVLLVIFLQVSGMWVVNIDHVIMDFDMKTINKTKEPSETPSGHVLASRCDLVSSRTTTAYKVRYVQFITLLSCVWQVLCADRLIYIHQINFVSFWSQFIPSLINVPMGVVSNLFWVTGLHLRNLRSVLENKEWQKEAVHSLHWSGRGTNFPLHVAGSGGSY